LTECKTFYVTDRPTGNVTTVAHNVHPLLAHMHKYDHATHQLLCQLRSGACHAKRVANAASVRRYCLPATDRLLFTTNI